MIFSFVEVPNVQRLTRDDMERNGIVITDGDNYPEEPSGWLYCSYCRKKFADPQRLEEHCKSWRHVLACRPSHRTPILSESHDRYTQKQLNGGFDNRCFKDDQCCMMFLFTVSHV